MNGKARNPILPVVNFVGPMPIAKKAPLEHWLSSSSTRIQLSNAILDDGGGISSDSNNTSINATIDDNNHYTILEDNHLNTTTTNDGAGSSSNVWDFISGTSSVKRGGFSSNTNALSSLSQG